MWEPIFEIFKIVLLGFFFSSEKAVKQCCAVYYLRALHPDGR